MLACTRLCSRTIFSAFRTSPVAAVGQLQRGLSTQTDGEERIASILKEKFPLASKLKVVDISGRLASTYGLFELYCHLPCTWCLG
ncbi:hypothetical protein GOODEAATRI_014068 [Goodea atripinnis]|uniref:Uncharacterized protein n=1 Tax=Goodea atripinnis TaxID=208336 RepID=A0ABV0N190_9TELE